MKTKQINKLTMYLAVGGICDGSPAVWQPLQAFADAYADFKTRVANIQAFGQSQAQDNSGVAKDKQAARAAMCNATLPITRAVHAYAVKTRNNLLIMQVNFTLSELMGGRDVQSAERCQNIYAAANANLAGLASYGITAAKLAPLGNAIAAYNALISAPRQVRAQGKTITGNIETEFAAADDALVLMDDLLGQLGDAKFVSNYTNARIIVDTAASHASPTPPATQPTTQMRA
jgi:hypothetical protein